MMRIQRAVPLAVAVLLTSFLILSLPASVRAGEIDDITRSVNEKRSRWQTKESRISKLPTEERRKRLGTLPLVPTGREKRIATTAEQLPAALDWRNYGGGNYVTPVKDLGTCGMCWAFATTAALESNVLITNNTPGIPFDLSEQVLASCSGAGTCVGGFTDLASDYLRDFGIPQEACYPYASTEGSCSTACVDWLYSTHKITEWSLVDRTPDAIKNALYRHGPLVTIMTVYTDFLYYSTGIYTHVSGNLEGYHAATIVGYNDAEQYFIVKSSWGTDWGEEGYFRIAYGEIGSDVQFGSWTIAYGTVISQDFPTVDGITRTAASADRNSTSTGDTGKKDTGGNTQTPSDDERNKKRTNDTNDTKRTDHSNGTPGPQTTNPGWTMVRMRPVTHEEAEAYYASARPQAAATTGRPFYSSLATDATSEITELARALRYDPKMIYDFVHNTIDYVPYFSSLKGATRTLLDGSGNDFDQASLMIALLRASGYTAQYQYGTMSIPATQLANWLDVDPTATSLATVLGSGGIPSGATIQANGTMSVTRVWVRATISGTAYVFDPAFKAYANDGKIDLAQAMGYNRNDLLATVVTGATISSNFVQNLNEANLRSKLAAWSTNLVGAIRNQYPNSDVREVVSGRKIVQTRLAQYNAALPFSNTVNYTWDDVPANRTATMTISMPNMSATFNISDMNGKRLVLKFDPANGNRPKLFLDGALYSSATPTSSYSVNTPYMLSISVYHTYAVGSANDSQTYTVVCNPNYSYAIVSDFGGTSDTLIQRRQRLLDGYLAQGLPADSEAVRGETMNIMGATWLKEVLLSRRLASGIAETVMINHHGIGLMAQEAGYYIDVKNYRVSITSKHNARADETAQFRSLALISSAFEHGMLEQLMGSSNFGISTMKLFKIANSTGRRIFLATSQTYTAIVRPQLQNYTTTDLNNFAREVDAGNTLVLPDNGQLCFEQLTGQPCVVGKWKGKGYISSYLTSASMSLGMMIGGGYNGGYGYSQGNVSPTGINTATQTSQYNSYTPTMTSLQASPLPSPQSIEPVDMASGAYLYDRTDLSLGGSAPLGLSFARSYDSRFNWTKRTMGNGWTHNYDITLAPLSHADPVLGARQPIDAAAFITALYAIHDLFKNEDNIRIWVTASLASKWAVDQTIDNAVNVRLGKKSMEFITLADGTYASPPGVTTKLIKNTDSTFSLQERFGTKIDFNAADATTKIATISRISDADNNQMTFTYTGANLTTVRDAYNRTLALGYAGGQLNSITDSTGRSVSYGYDANGNLYTYTDQEAKVWRYGYDASHQMTTLSTPLSIITATNSYDIFGRVKTQLVPRQFTTAIYNFYFSGYRNVEEDPLGNTIAYYFDEKGRQNGQEDALGNRSSVVYDGQNHSIQTTDPRSYSTKFQYDGNHNVRYVVSALTTTTELVYDPQFRLQDTYDPLRHNTHFEYDTHHHRTLTRDHMSNTTLATYNGPKGFPDTATDGRSTVTYLTYDGYGNPYTVRTGLHTAVTFTYDALGRMISLTDQVNNRTQFQYDKRGLPTRIIDPVLTTSTTFTYYNDGSLWQKTDRNGNTITYYYTPTGKLDTVGYPNGAAFSFTYNVLDQLWVMRGSRGDTVYSYDPAGRLASTNDDNTLSIVSYIYDEAGNLKELVYPGNKKVIYTYDEMNRLKTVTIDWLTAKPAATYNYEPQEAGLLDNMIAFNGITTSYSYDAAHRLRGLSSSVASYQFTDIDENGNRKTVSQTEPLLASFAVGTTSYSYSYSSGNPGNRLMSAGGNGFAYDNEGQLRNGYESTYTFDYEHRLTGVGGSLNYYYDGAGQRFQAIRSGVTTRYIYDAAGNLLAEADSNNVMLNNITRYYIYGAGLLAMVTPAGDVYNYHYNAIGSTVAITDQSQTVVNKYAYDPFGEVLNQVEALPQPFKFVGQAGVMTEPNGFYYMRARYYDPKVGRFISEDPIGFGGGDVNLYGYVGNNPVMLIDPSGLTAASNASFLWDWVTGGGSSNRFYGPNTVETQEMQNSPGAAALRNDFYAGGGKNFAYGSGQAAWDTVINPATADWSSTAAQVGGFAGATAINNGNGTATFTITNVAGTNSFFYHAVPDRSGTTGPMRNIKQTFQWTEKCK